PGALLTYTITVSNGGPSDVTGAQVVDTLPAALAGFGWTCTATAPATCGTPSGSGNINTLVNLPAGSHVTFSVTGVVPAGTTGTLLNSVTVNAPAGITDPVPGNNTGVDTNPVGPQADLLVTKSSSPVPYIPGAPLTY